MYKRALSGLLAINLIFLIGVLSLCRMEEIGRKLQQTVSEVHMEESLLADKESIMTKDLALITSLENVTVLNSEGFIKAVRESLEQELA